MEAVICVDIQNQDFVVCALNIEVHKDQIKLVVSYKIHVNKEKICKILAYISRTLYEL